MKQASTTILVLLMLLPAIGFGLASALRAEQRAWPVPADAAGSVPFVVLGDADEARLTSLTDADLAGPIQHVNLFRAETTDHVIEAVTGQVPHDELARFLLLALVVGLLVEGGEVITHNYGVFDPATGRVRGAGSSPTRTWPTWATQ